MDGAKWHTAVFQPYAWTFSYYVLYTGEVNIIQAFQSFGQIKILTEGGPNESTNANRLFYLQRCVF